MTSRKVFKYLFILMVLVGTGFALADALGVFNTKPYKIVYHGSMRHYVPYNRDPDVEIERFPTRPPGPDELITPTGQIVKKTEWKLRQRKSRHGKVEKDKNQQRKTAARQNSMGS